MSLVQLLQCTIATGRPSGVVTMSISRWTPRGLSVTIIAKSEVPALTLPVLTRTEFVATMPVPASPSQGATGMPGRSAPVGSRKSAPASVSLPALAPAGSTFGRIARRSMPLRALNFCTMPSS